MPRFEYEDGQLPAVDLDVLVRRLEAAGYTDCCAERRVMDDGTTTGYLSVAEADADDVDLLAAVSNTAEPSFTISASELTVAADGVDTAVLSMTGPAGAVVELRYTGMLPVDKQDVVLDGGGSGSVTFGPFPSGFRLPKSGIQVRFRAPGLPILTCVVKTS